MNYLEDFKFLTDYVLHSLLPPILWSGGLTLLTIYVLNLLIRNIFGKDSQKCSPSSENHDKKFVINEIRRRRKVDNLPPPYPRGWFAICSSSSLRPGEVREAYAFGQDLVIWRGVNSGQAFVANGYCPHLGAHLGVGGKVTGDCVTCPFHHWSFDGSKAGACASAPNNPSLPNVRLKMWPSCETNDFILIWNANGASDPNPSWNVPNFPNVVPGNQFGSLTTPVFTHIQDIAENGADFSHVKTLHSTLAKVPPWIQRIFDLKEVWHPEFRPGDGDSSHEANYTVDYYLEAFGGKFKFGESSFLGKQFGPGLFLYEMSTPLGSLIITEAVTPVEELNSGIILQFYRQPNSWRTKVWASTLMRMYLSDFKKDVKIWNRKCTPRAPEFVSTDSAIKSFRRYYSQFY